MITTIWKTENKASIRRIQRINQNYFQKEKGRTRKEIN